MAHPPTPAVKGRSRERDILDRVLDDSAHARRMAESGHELTAREYDTFVLSRRIKALYEEITREKA